jgi:hypothetical protein
MLYPTALKDIRPFVATPNHSGVMSSIYVQGLLGLVNLAWSRGMSMQTRFLDGDSLITRARNRLAAEFLADTRWTHLFWIDADVGFAPDAALRLLLSGHDVVAGIYPMKTDDVPPRFPVQLRQGARVDLDGFAEVDAAPTGFMLIAREVLVRMAEAMPELRYSADPVPGVPDIRGSNEGPVPHYRFFDVLAEPGNGRYLSEDFAFCHRWRALGGRVMADTTSNLTHHGAHHYRGRFDAAFKA